MAHFAEIDENNIVLRVIRVDDEHETNGEAFCHNLLGGNWIQTSFNGSIRKNYAGIGYTYDSIRDAFIPPKPEDDSILDEETCKWSFTLIDPSQRESL